jgi:hypothetical protein
MRASGCVALGVHFHGCVSLEQCILAAARVSLARERERKKSEWPNAFDGISRAGLSDLLLCASLWLVHCPAWHLQWRHKGLLRKNMDTASIMELYFMKCGAACTVLCSVYCLCLRWLDKKKHTRPRASSNMAEAQSKFIGAMMLYGTSQMNGTKGWCASSIYFLLSLSCNRPAAELIVWMEFMARRDKKYFINLQPTAICMRTTGPIFRRKMLSYNTVLEQHFRPLAQELCIHIYEDSNCLLHMRANIDLDMCANSDRQPSALEARMQLSCAY